MLEFGAMASQPQVGRKHAVHATHADTMVGTAPGPNFMHHSWFRSAQGTQEGTPGA